MSVPYIQSLPGFRLANYSYIVPEIDFKDLPSIDIVYPQKERFPEVEPILNTFFTVMYFFVISEKFDLLYSNINSIFNFLSSKLDLEKTLIMKKYSKKLEALLSSFGSLNSTLPSGLFLRDINEIQIDELSEFKQFVIKYINEHFDEIKSFVDNIIKAYSSVDDLYRDIFEKDFRITYDLHMEIMSAISERFNEALNIYLSAIEEFNLRLKAFEEYVERERINLEKVRELLEKSEFEQELVGLLNEYKRFYADYLIEVERFKLLTYEQYKSQIRIYESKLNKFATEIKLISSVANYITERVNNYFIKADTKEQQIKLNELLINLKNSEFAINEEDFKAFLDEKRAELETIKSNIDTYAMDLRNFEERIRLAIEQSKANLADYKSENMDLLIKLLERRQNAYEKYMNLVKTVINYSKDYEENYFIERERINFNRESLREASYLTERIYRSTLDLNKALSLSCSNISASIVRTFASGA